MKIRSFCRSLLLIVVLLFAFQASCFAVNYIDVTFEGTAAYDYYTSSDFLPGQVVPTAPNSSDRPCCLDKADGFTVENSSTVTGSTLLTGNFMRIQDSDDYAANGAHFDFYDRTYGSGCVRVSWDVLFESYDDYFFYFRNGRGDDFYRPAKSSVADIYAFKDKKLVFESKDGRIFSTTYGTGTPIHFDCYFDLDNNQWAAVINGEVLFNDAVIDDAPLGLFIPGYVHDQDFTGAMQVDNIQMLPRDGCEWPQMNAQCPSGLPDPQLVLTGTRNIMVSGVQRLQYLLSVTNRNVYPEALFAPAPNLPACGINTNSSRTWVDIFDQDDNRMYGFCALGTPDNLSDLWFDAAMADPGMTAVRVKFNDRLCEREYPSNLVAVTPDMFATVTLNINGSGKVSSSDGFECVHDQLSGSQSCSLTYLKGQTISFYPQPINGEEYTSSFAQWSAGACSGTGTCTLTITSDVTIDAQFAAVGVPVFVEPLPLPSSAHVFDYAPVVFPEYNSNPAACKPFAAGNVAQGTLDLKMGLPPFAAVVDVYLALYAPAINPAEIYLLVPLSPVGYTLAPFSTSGLVPWKTAVSAPGAQNFYGSIPLTIFPAGPYSLLTLVTPAGATQLTDYYLWVSTFTVQ